MTLSHYLHLRSRTADPAEARTLLQPIMEGVALLHKSGLIHRGICPDNIVLPIDGTARLTGYGTLALRTGGSELKEPALPGLRRAGAILCRRVQRALHRCLRAGRGLLQGWSQGQTPVAAPQRKVRDSLSRRTASRRVCLHGSRRCWPAHCGWTRQAHAEPCPS